MNKAYFVKHPRTYLDLQVPHTTDHEALFEIVSTVELTAIDYENFIYGLDADRQYIEHNAHLCADGNIKKCILVKKGDKKDGILVVPEPDDPSFVLSAAYLNKINRI